jgi:hypothetical protein
VLRLPAVPDLILVAATDPPDAKRSQRGGAETVFTGRRIVEGASTAASVIFLFASTICPVGARFSAVPLSYPPGPAGERDSRAAIALRVGIRRHQPASAAGTIPPPGRPAGGRCLPGTSVRASALLRRAVACPPPSDSPRGPADPPQHQRGRAPVGGQGPEQMTLLFDYFACNVDRTGNLS